MKVIVPKDSPLAFQKILSIQDVFDYPIVLYTSQIWENAIQSLEKRYGPINVLFRTSNSEVIKKTVSEGLAIGLVTSYTLIDDPYDLWFCFTFMSINLGQKAIILSFSILSRCGSLVIGTKFCAFET